MPSGTIPAAVMAVSDEIWEYEEWKARTKYTVTPFTEGVTHDQLGMSNRELRAVKALAERLHLKPEYGKRIEAFATVEDNDKAGKAAWTKWLNARYGGWMVRKDVEEMLHEYGRHPRQILREDGSVS